MSHEKRVVLAFALSFVILVIWGTFFFKKPPAPPPPAKPAAVESQAARSQPTQAAKPAPAAPAPVWLPAQQGKFAEEIVVENDLYRLTFSTEGAVVKSWVLKKYRDAEGKPLDVVHRAACQALGFPMSLNLADAELSKQLNSALYVASPSWTALKAPAKLEFVYSDGKTQARKLFSFGHRYEIRVEVSVSDGRRFVPVEVSWPGGFGDHSLPEARKNARVVYGSPSDLENESEGDVEELRSVKGPLQVAGTTDRYFVSIFLPETPEHLFRFERQTWTPPDWNKDPKSQKDDDDKPKPLAVKLGTSESKPLAFRLFVAPKDLDALRSANPPLDFLLDYGWFSFVAKPLFLALRYIHDHWVHNYGWAIVVLTLLITMALFPLKLKSIRAAQEMQRIAPLVKGIQEKYKGYKFNDPRKQRMQQEIMKLYKEHHINPLGGCLPMVLQLPFLYGFYMVLDISIELRHAPWFWWIRDLSAPDGHYILPTLMIVTMFILQKMTPMTTADPAQQRMMMIMPLVFGVMFYSFASGLVLYWLTSNVVGIAQQMFINRMIPAKPLAAPEPHRAASAKH